MEGQGKTEIEEKKKVPEEQEQWWRYHVSFDGINQFEYGVTSE